MTKLEDIELKLGDKITWEDGDITFVSKYCGDIQTIKDYVNEDCSFECFEESIVKIERYIYKSTTWGDNPKNIYYLETIWNKEEDLNKKELKQELSNVMSEIDTLRNEIEEYHSLMHSCRNKAEFLKKKLSEIQSEVNK